MSEPIHVTETFKARVGEGIAGWVAHTGRPLLVDDVEKHPLFKRPSRKRYSTKSLLSVPLRLRNDVLGVLNVNNKTDASMFAKADELLLSVVANFVVIALEKARMRVIEREKHRLDTALRVAREIQESILPTDFPSHPHFELAARNLPAHEVAGDFYDIIPLQDILYTDRITESRSDDETMYGDRRLIEVVESCDGPPSEIIERTLDSVRSFTKRESQRDDLTMVVAKKA